MIVTKNLSETSVHASDTMLDIMFFFYRMNNGGQKLKHFVASPDLCTEQTFVINVSKQRVLQKLRLCSKFEYFSLTPENLRDFITLKIIRCFSVFFRRALDKV